MKYKFHLFFIINCDFLISFLVVKSRKVIARAVSNQYFGCFMVSGKDGAWLPPALSGYLWSLWLRKTFGNSEYRHFIFQVRLENFNRSKVLT